VLTLHSSLQRKRKAPRDSSTAAVSAAESTKQMMKKKQFSRKINYDALGDIFKNEEEIKQATGSRRSRKRGHADEASDGEDLGGVRGYFQSDADESEMEVVEEAEGQLPSSHPSRRQESRAMRKHKASKARSQSRGSATGDAMSSAGEEALSTRTSPGPEADADDPLAEMRRMRGAHAEDDGDDGYQDAGY
jgi:transcription factor IIIB subunit 2